MEITTQSGLAVARLEVKYEHQSIQLDHVLLDTGCAVSIFDTDCVELIGLVPNRKKARLVCMTGIGGRGDFCVEQITSELIIDQFYLYRFRHQLGDIRYRYGFDAILGNDFLMASGLIQWDKRSAPHSLIH